MPSTSIDFEKIKQQVKKVIQNTQDIEDPKVDELIQEWYESKKEFINAFGGLVWESPNLITFPIGEDQKKRNVYNFADYIARTYQNLPLTFFIEDNINSFYSNRIDKDKNYSGTKVPKGMKIVKAFKYFEENKNVLDKLQMEASQIIQEDKIEGKLCFSVHPLDFLSSSENTYNWRSCHALDGDYRAGNLSYMLDKSTVICYLKGADNIILPAFGAEVPWNSKKWRVLFFVSDNWEIVSPGRQYPFSSDGGLKKACDSFIDLLNGHNNFNKSNFSELKTIEHTTRGFAIPFNGEAVLLRNFVFDTLPALHYNDLLYSSCYRMKYLRNKKANSLDYFHIGSNVKCLNCGKSYIQDSTTMMCPQCECEFGTEENDIYGFCDCCGARGYRDDFYFVENDMVCPCCYEQNCGICEHCGEAVYNVNLVYDRELDEYICKDCYLDRYDN